MMNHLQNRRIGLGCVSAGIYILKKRYLKIFSEYVRNIHGLMDTPLELF